MTAALAIETRTDFAVWAEQYRRREPAYRLIAGGEHALYVRWAVSVMFRGGRVEGERAVFQEGP